MGSNKELLLVHSGMKRAFLSHSVNIMLTPQFYTLKKEELPVKYLYQAKRIAPSLFDGLLEQVGSYEYLVYKEEDKWVFIAYNLGQIRSLLLSKGISPEQVSKIFFAQQALSSFSSPVLLEEKEALIALDNTVVMVPQTALEEGVKPLTFDSSFAPKKGVVIQGDKDSILSVGQAMMLAVIFTIFAGMFFVEGLRYGNDSTVTQEEMQTLLEEYPSLQSQYTRESVAAKYKEIDSNEREKREVIKSFSSIIFKGVTLTSVMLNEKGFKAEFACSDEKVAKRLNELAKKENMKSSKIAGANAIQIEGTL